MTIDYTLFPFMDRSGGCERRQAVGTGPAAYVTGGETVDPLADFKLGTVWRFVASPPVNATPIILQVVYNTTTNKLVWFDMAGVQVANGTDLSGYTYTFEVTGQ